MNKSYVILGLTGAESFVYALVCYFVLTGYIVPVRDSGAVDAVISTVRILGSVAILALLHGLLQRWLDRNRPVNLTWQWRGFDLLTSVLPLISLVFSLFIMWRAPVAYKQWWNEFQGFVAVIILLSTVDDIWFLFRTRATPAAAPAHGPAAHHP